MLVLTRRPNERFVVVCPDGTVITCLVVEVRGDKSRLGIDAPKNYAVHRLEVYQAIQAAKQSQPESSAV